jgi:hypothetical protein
MANSPPAPSEKAFVDELAARVEKALERGEVDWDLVLSVGMLRALNGVQYPRQKALAMQYEDRLVDAFRETHGCSALAIFPPVGGVYLLEDGEFEWRFDNSRIYFDWSEAWTLVYRIERLAEDAREWWPPTPASHERGRGLTGRIAEVLSKTPDKDPHKRDRRPHSSVAYGLATWVMGSIKRENLKHSKPSGGDLPSPSQEFTSSLTNFRDELEAAQARFRIAAQRTSQSRYWEGALLGAAALAAVCGLVGIIFLLLGTAAMYGIAAPAGGLGAMVSLLQRMSSGRLQLQADAGRDLLEVFGAVRPFIGAVFGMAVMALLLGGLVPVIEIPLENRLAFFAGVGFLAGFNERWAQDMLQSSTRQVEGLAGSEQRDVQNLG